MSSTVAVDLGGTNVRAALVTERGEIERAARERVGGRAPGEVADQIVAMVQALSPPERTHPVVVDVPGSVWTATGTVLNAPNLGWRDVAFGELLARRLGRPVRLVNDLNAITFGEARAGAGKGAADVTCVFVGTGLGMGAVVGGKLLEGAEGLAPELGHIKRGSPDSGLLCGCGQRGCLEAYVSGTHLPELYRAKMDQSGVRDHVPATAGELEAAAVAGDIAARALWDEVADHLAWGLGVAVMTLNPRVLVLGGGVLTAAPSLYERVVRRLWGYAWPAFGKHLLLAPTMLGDDAGLVGGALLARELASSSG